jgi:hypothetical protein
VGPLLDYKFLRTLPLELLTSIRVAFEGRRETFIGKPVKYKYERPDK